jgi:ferric-dicitrate binding protein FerR (iron transport regulator)
LLQKAAAILILPLLGLSIWLMMDRQPQTAQMILATAKGEHTHVFLPDGSEVWLNVDSRLEYSTTFSASNRELKLDGEAFFKVAKDKKYPFIVSANDLEVKVVGTEFNVSAYKTEPNVSTFLKEGIVELKYFPEGKKEQTYRMAPGEKATIIRDEKSIRIMEVTSGNDTRWTKGELYFENEPMDQVFRKIERWYNVKISYQLDDFTNETLNVNLKDNESIDRLLEIINEAIGINVKQNGNKYVITRSSEIH